MTDQRAAAGGGVVSLLLAVAAVAWIGAVAYLAWRGWPYIPLDVSAKDPATLAAHRDAVLRHAAVSAALALLPAGVLLLLARRLGRRPG